MRVHQDLTEIFRRGVLVNLRTSVWTGRVRIPKDRIELDADDEFWSAVKYLVSRSALKPIERIRGESRTYLYDRSLPFPLPGAVFVPRDMITDIDAELNKMQTKFWEKVNEFEGKYADFVTEAAPRLGSLFNPADYPRDIRRRFGFEWQFYTVGLNGNGGLLAPEVYEREKRKLEQTMKSFAEDAVLALRKRFLDMLSHITDRLCGFDKKIFRDSLIGNPKAFMADFHKLNICDDEELAGAVEQVRQILDGVEPEALRQDVTFRDGIGKKVAAVQEHLEELMVSAEGRDIELPDFDEDA